MLKLAGDFLLFATPLVLFVYLMSWVDGWLYRRELKEYEEWLRKRGLQ